MTRQTANNPWYYTKGKKKVGPVSLARLRSLLAEGVLKPEDMVFQEGTTKWRKLAEVATAGTGTVRTGRLWKLAVCVTGALVLLTLVVWGLVVVLRDPNGNKDLENPGPVAEIPKDRGPARAGSEEAKKGPSAKGDQKPKLPTPQERDDVGLKAEPAVSPKHRPTLVPRAQDQGKPRLPVIKHQPKLVAQLGHSLFVTSVSLSGDSKWLATGSGDQTARLWEVDTGREVRVFRHSTTVSSLALSKDGKWLVTANGDNIARLWEVATGAEVRAFRGHSDKVFHVAFSSDSKWLVTGSSDSTARLWEVATGREVRAFRGHSGRINSISLSGDSKWLVTAGFDDKTVRLWDVATGQEVRAFVGHADRVDEVFLSEDGEWLATAGFDKTVRLWDVATGKTVRVFRGDSNSSLVTSVTLSGDGKWLIIGSGDVTTSKKGRRSVTRLANNTARLWEAATGKEVRAFRHSDSVRSLFLSSDGKWLVTGSYDNIARLWEVATGKEVQAFKGHSVLISPVSISVNGKWLITGGDLWDVATGKALRDFRAHSKGVNSISMSPDGKWLATGNYDDTVRIWETATGKEVRAFRNHSGYVSSVCLSADGKWLVTGSWDKTARLWQVATAKEIRAFRGHSDWVISLFLSKDGRWLVTGSNDSTARLWEVATGKEVRAFQGHVAVPGRSGGVTSVSLSADGNWLVTGSYDNTARLWEVATGNEVRAFRGHLAGLTSVSLTGDAKWLVTGSYDNTARLWEVATGKEVRAFRGHFSWVDSVSLSGDGKRVLTGSWDSTARLWDAATGRELCRLISFRDGTWAVIDPGGRFDAANGGDVEGLHWVAGNETIALKQLKERYYDPGLLAKYMDFNKEPLREVKALRDVKLFPEVAAAKTGDPSSTELTLDLTNRGGGIGKVQVLVNGKELLADARGPKFDPGQAKARMTIDLALAPTLRPGQKNKVTIFTWNEEGYLSSRGLDLDWNAPGRKEERPIELYAILCGVSEYSAPALNLRFAAKDAEDMAQALEVGAKRLFGADKVHLTLLTTSKVAGDLLPTKANLQRAFEQVRKQARPGDVLVVYLAGHGVSLRAGSDQYCFLTREARTTDPTALSDPALLAQMAVTSTELTEWVKKIPALKQVLVFDTCAAGAAAAKLAEVRQVTGDQIRAIDRLKDRTGFHVLMGCAADKVSYEATPFEQGLLTHALLKVMRGAKLREGEFLDVSELFQYARDEVPRLARGIGGVQSPLIAAPKGADSFDIARFTEADKSAVPLKSVKPLVLRPSLVNRDLDFDDLKLRGALAKRLADVSLSGERGKSRQFPAVYVDADEMPGALRPSGTYVVKGEKVEVRLRLIRDGKPVQTEPFLIEGARGDLEGLIDRLVETISRQAGRKE